MSQTSPDVLYCVNHPDRETLLRCNRCERPICPECAVLTPTGYRCKDCVRNQQKVFDTAQWFDYPLAIVIAGVLSFLGSLITSLLGFFTLFVAPIAGAVIAEAVRWATRRRRSRWLYRAATLAAVIGGVVLILAQVAGFLFGLNGLSIWPLVWQGAYVALVGSTVFYRLTGIKI
ncbi:B-box zinc finger protein [uncultured Thermanaerothrix sp.]|uniref:B-box zinc finger protein n=1 Tax=uncultured Thermanaerothrix sp. TaxID=1195149 RepID=UPI00260FE70B|nr:B-box zinc finger protein [uncultured Thermanaerothrix sp.]